MKLPAKHGGWGWLYLEKERSLVANSSWRLGTWPSYEIGPAQPIGLLFTACICLLSAAHPFPGRSKFWWARRVGFYGIIQSFTPRWFSGSIETCQMRSPKKTYITFWDLMLHDSYWIMKSHLFPIKSQAKFQETVSLTASQGRFQVVKRANEPVLTMGIAGLAGAQGPRYSGPEEKRKPARLLTWFIVRGNWWVCNNPQVEAGL